MIENQKTIEVLERTIASLTSQLLEKDRALLSLHVKLESEQIRASNAARVLMANSAISKLYEQKKSELQNTSQQLKHAESELLIAQKMESIGRLAAGLAHEINTPIQFLTDSVYFMQEGLKDLFDYIDSQKDGSSTNDKEAEYMYLREHLPHAIERATEGISRVAELVRSIKSFSHPDRTSAKPFNVNEGLASTLAICRNEYKYVADIATHFGKLPSITCVGGEINQVFLNLIVNAAHAVEDANTITGKRGKITVSTTALGNQVKIDITDTGLGIPVEVQNHIFDLFFTTKEVGRGTGQGLAIARQVVVQNHGGSLTFETKEGLGTTFTILLPIESRQELAA